MAFLASLFGEGAGASAGAGAGATGAASAAAPAAGTTALASTATAGIGAKPSGVFTQLLQAGRGALAENLGVSQGANANFGQLMQGLISSGMQQNMPSNRPMQQNRQPQWWNYQQ